MTLVWASGYNGVTDPDAQTYIAAVEAADGQALEGDVALAINDFVVGCKLDGIWDAIKASCILAGARTLSGALVPLVGTAPSNYNFVAADYNRETGLVGDGSTKYLDSNRAATTTSPTDYHQSAYMSVKPTTGSAFVASDYTYTQRYLLYFNTGADETRVISGTFPNAYLGGAGSLAAGFKGVSRDNSSTFNARAASTTNTVSAPSGTSTTSTSFVFATNIYGTAAGYSNARLSFYSIGESIDLEKLDNRTTRLMNLISYSLASGLPDLSTMDIDAALYIGAVYRAGGTLS